MASHMRTTLPSGSMRASEPFLTWPSTTAISLIRVGLAKVARCAVRWSPRWVAYELKSSSGRPILARYSPAALLSMMALDGDRWSVVMLSPSTASGRSALSVRSPASAPSQYGGRRMYVLFGRQSYSGLTDSPLAAVMANIGS